MKPNIIYVIPDEFRPYSMGFLGKEKVKTPNLDRFAAQGTACTNVVSNFPICSPHRGILMSGLYPKDNGVTTNCNSGNDVSLNKDLYCLSDHLSDSGYETGYIGKWHLTSPAAEDAHYGEGLRGDGRVWDCYTPPGKERHSFDFWYSYGCCDNHNQPHYWIGEAPREEPTEVQTWSAIHETSVAIDFIENKNGVRNEDKPFALFVAYNPPHMPFDQVPQRYKDIYKDYEPEDLLVWENLSKEGMKMARPHVKNYYSMISGIDDQFGRILDSLKDKGLDENTIVIFTSDHGEMMGSHGLMNKDVWFNESLLVPFLIRYPGVIREGVEDDMLFSTIDLYPTLLGLSGNRENMAGDLAGKDNSNRMISGEGEDSGSALYLNMAQLSPYGGARGVKTDRYTLVFKKENDQLEWFLYDNLKDPHQLNNIYGEDIKIERALKKELTRLLEVAKDPFIKCFPSL